jgi:hypothetical protein
MHKHKLIDINKYYKVVYVCAFVGYWITMEAVLPIYEFSFELFNYLHGPHTSSALICTNTVVEYKKCGKTLLKAIRNFVHLNILHLSTYFKP